MAYARLQLIHLPAPANLGMRERTVASVRLNDTLFDLVKQILLIKIAIDGEVNQFENDFWLSRC